LCGAALEEGDTDTCSSCVAKQSGAEGASPGEGGAQAAPVEPSAEGQKSGKKRGRRKEGGVSVAEILAAPFHGVVFLEALIMLIPIFLLVLPIVIAPVQMGRFLAQDPKVTGFLLKYVVFGIASFVIVCRCAALAAIFECGKGFERNRIQAWLMGTLFLILIVLTDTPLRLAFRSVSPSYAESVLVDLQAIPMGVLALEGAGWWGTFIGINVQLAAQIWAVLSNLPWFVNVALVWYVIYRPFAVAMAGAYEEWDPTEVIRGMMRCLLPYLGVLVMSFLYGLLIWEIVLAVALSAGPSMAALEIGPEAGVRIGLVILLLVSYISCYTYAVKYPMLGCLIRKYWDVSKVELDFNKLPTARVQK
jgi:hypothetical protein